MPRERLDKSSLFRVPDMSLGYLAKMDKTKLPPGYAYDAKNLRFQTGAAQGRLGNHRLQGLTRPSGALSFPGTTTDYGRIPLNSGCKLFTGFGPQFTIEFVVRPVSFPAAPAKAQLFELGGAGFSTVEVFTGSGTPLVLQASFRDTSMSAGVTYSVGSFDGTSGYTDRRYYVRFRRKGRDLDILVVGAAAGVQYNVYADVFTAVGTLMKGATATYAYVGGKGVAGTTAGMIAKLDEFRIWNRYIEETRPYWWSTHPMTEVPECLCAYGFDEGGSGAVCLDGSLHENTMELVGSPTRVAGLVSGLAVGQVIGTHTDTNIEHRLVGAGGSLYREVVR